MATIRTSIQISDGMTPAFRSMNNAMNIVLNSFESIQSASHNAIDTNSIQAARQELAKAETAFIGIENQIKDANTQQQNFNSQILRGESNANGLLNKIKGYAGAFIGLAALKKGIDITDTYTSNAARLKLINDNLQTQEGLQYKIYAAAQRSRGGYNDMVNTVAKLNLLAGNAFNGNNDTIRFTELMNKAFKVSGASATESTNAMYQLTQAMASNRLQGDELRSIRENAPMLMAAIEKFTGKSGADLQKMAEQGEISASIIKNSLYSAGNDIEEKFKTLPKTFGDVWTSIENTATMQFSNVMQKVNNFLNSDTGTAVTNGINSSIGTLSVLVGNLVDGLMMVATIITENWSWISPIVWGIVAAVAAYNLALFLCNAQIAIKAKQEAFAAASAALHSGMTLAEAAATTTATGAQVGLNAALYACPLVWIIGLIIIIITLFYAAVNIMNKMAGTSVSATGIIGGAFYVVGAIVGNIFIALFNTAVGILADVWNFIASFAEFFANVFNDPVGSIVRLFASMADFILGILENLAGAMDTLFGSNMAESVAGWRDSIQNWVNDNVGEAQIKIQRLDKSTMQLQRVNYSQAFSNGYNAGKGVEDSISKAFSGADISSQLGQLSDLGLSTAANTGSTADNTASAAKSLSASEEDLKYLRDLAEQETVNRFTTAQITINSTNNNNINSDLDIDGVVSKIEEKLYESMSVAAEGVYSY